MKCPDCENGVVVGYFARMTDGSWRDELLALTKDLKEPIDGDVIGRSKFWTVSISMPERNALLARAKATLARIDGQGGEG